MYNYLARELGPLIGALPKRGSASVREDTAQGTKAALTSTSILRLG
jgi:hypothetical protein